MSEEPKKTISADDKLRALALFTMAKQHYVECRKFELGLAKLLGRADANDVGHLSDALYSGNDISFDEALEREGFTVADEG